MTLVVEGEPPQSPADVPMQFDSSPASGGPPPTHFFPPVGGARAPQLFMLGDVPFKMELASKETLGLGQEWTGDH